MSNYYKFDGVSPNEPGVNIKDNSFKINISIRRGISFSAGTNSLHAALSHWTIPLNKNNLEIQEIQFQEDFGVIVNSASGLIYSTLNIHGNPLLPPCDTRLMFTFNQGSNNFTETVGTSTDLSVAIASIFKKSLYNENIFNPSNSNLVYTTFYKSSVNKKYHFNTNKLSLNVLLANSFNGLDNQTYADYLLAYLQTFHAGITTVNLKNLNTRIEFSGRYL